MLRISFKDNKLPGVLISGLLAILIFISVWIQFDFIRRCLDTDMDSYIHFVCGRRILQNPGYLAIHWVWLPFYHYYLAGLILLGATFDAVRYINVGIFILTAMLFYRYIYQKRDENIITAALTAAVFLLFPVNMLTANSAEPEMLFSLTILGYAICMQRKRFAAALILICIATLFRYEAWAVWAFTGMYFLYYAVKNKTLRYEGSYVPLLIVILPVVFVFGWAVLRAIQKPPLFGFIHSTMDFARTKGTSKLLTLQTDNPLLKFVYDISFYAVRLPVLFSGVLILFSAAGLKKTVQKHFWIALTGSAVLVFITLSWMMKSNLGLNRHYVTVVPFYALSIALGVENVYRLLAAKLSRALEGLDLRLLKFPIYLFVVVFLLDFALIWHKIWQDISFAAYTERREALTFMKTLPADAAIFSNDSVCEILSGRDSTSYRRLWIHEDKDGFMKIQKAVARKGEAYLLFDDLLLPYVKGRGEIIFRSQPNRDSKTVFMMMKFLPSQNPQTTEGKR